MHKRKLAGVSLLETVITIGIFGLLMAMLMQTLLLNIQISRRITERSRVREELTALTGFIQRDMRNASVIDANQCGLVELDNSPTHDDPEFGCVMSHVSTVMWVYGHDSCPTDSICKIDIATGDILYNSADILKIDQANFELQTFEVDGSKGVLMVTLYASPANPNWDVSQQVRQISVATRNFF